MGTARLCVHLCLLSALCLSVQAHARFPAAYSYSNFYRAPAHSYSHNALYQLPTQLPTLTVVQEEAYAMDDKMARVPLVLVPSNRLKVVHGGATYLHQTYYGHQELPAIRLVLPQPMLVNRPTTMIEFPAGFTVVHEGYRVPLRVAAVLAPVYTTSGPQEIRVVYAIPSQTFSYQTYEPVQPIRRPTQPSSVVSSSYPPPQQPNAYLPPSNAYLPPSNVYAPVSTDYLHHATPQVHLQPPTTGPIHQVARPILPAASVGSSGPKRPTVTILDFPSSVSSPNTLFFQPPPDPESELGYREPPQGVVPAGIVQSTAPIPNVSLFINSKESPILQALRDEAQRNRLSSNAFNDDYAVIIN